MPSARASRKHVLLNTPHETIHNSVIDLQSQLPDLTASFISADASHTQTQSGLEIYISYYEIK